MSCPECATELSAKVKFCSNCGAQQITGEDEELRVGTGATPAVGESDTAIGPAQIANARIKAIILGVLLLILAPLAYQAWKLSEEQSRRDSKAGSPDAPGQLGILRTDDGDGWVPVYKTEQAQSHFSQLLLANDALGMTQMFRVGDVLQVPSGTACLVIEPGLFTFEIRILGSVHAGRSGLVYSEFVHASRDTGPSRKSRSEEAREHCENLCIAEHCVLDLELADRAVDACVLRCESECR